MNILYVVVIASDLGLLLINEHEYHESATNLYTYLRVFSSCKSPFLFFVFWGYLREYPKPEMVCFDVTLFLLFWMIHHRRADLPLGREAAPHPPPKQNPKNKKKEIKKLAYFSQLLRVCLL